MFRSQYTLEIARELTRLEFFSRRPLADLMIPLDPPPVKTQENSDRIQIERLEMRAHIGVPDDERFSAQRLTFSLTLWPIRPMNDLSDEISRAVNYASVCAETKKFDEQRSDKLIETLADALARHLLKAFEIRRITIELRKYILPDVEFVSITVTRDRAEITK